MTLKDRDLLELQHERRGSFHDHNGVLRPLDNAHQPSKRVVRPSRTHSEATVA